MEVFHFAATHGFEFVGTVAITASLLFTAFELRHVVKAHRVTNQFTLTAHHREIWTLPLKMPSLSRVSDPNVDLSSNPITHAERIFVTFLIFHLHNSFQAEGAKMFRSPPGLTSDIARFFDLPIPGVIWAEVKHLQDPDFVSFVELARERRGAVEHGDAEPAQDMV